MSEYIERDAAIALLEEKQRSICPLGRCNRHAVYGSDRDLYDAIDADIDAVLSIPAADVVEVKHGEWVSFKSEHAGDIWYCSACDVGCTWRPSYCPNCGAKMLND